MAPPVDDLSFPEKEFGEAQPRAPEIHPPMDPGFDDFTTDDLEAAYLRALEAMESDDWVVGPDAENPSDDLDDVVDDSAEFGAGSPPTIQPTNQMSGSETGTLISTTGPDQGDGGVVTTHESREILPSRSNTACGDVEIAGADFLSGGHESSGQFDLTNNAQPKGNVLPGSSNSPSKTTDAGGIRQAEVAVRDKEMSQPPPNATRIIEASLFVGGQPLSARRLGTLLESTADPSFIDNLVDELNLEYASQQRPYEIRLGDGGYRIALRTEFEAVRNRVYGVGPRDVKLSQDVLEILALVAYQQPIAHSAVEACGKPNVANILRQLLRRELITLVRIDPSRNGVEYRTSFRFLQVFGLGNLNELPRPEDLAMR